jgi:hypothetical protein
MHKQDRPVKSMDIARIGPVCAAAALRANEEDPELGEVPVEQVEERALAFATILGVPESQLGRIQHGLAEGLKNPGLASRRAFRRVEKLAQEVLPDWSIDTLGLYLLISDELAEDLLRVTSPENVEA